MNLTQVTTGCATAQARVLSIAGGKTSRKVQQVLHLDGSPMFIMADTINPKPLRTPYAWSPGKVRSIVNLRLSGLRKLILGRHAGPCDTDDGETYYHVALVHLAAKAWAYGLEEHRIDSHKWALMWTPRLAVEHPVDWFEAQEQRILVEFDNRNGRPALPSADNFARDLGITAAEVKAYRLQTIGATDRPKAQRLADAREADRNYQAAKRASKGATPHSQSISALKPWLAYGISNRRTWERKVERGELPPHPAMRTRVANSSDDVKTSGTSGAGANPPSQDLAPPVVMRQPVAANDDVPQAGPAMPSDGWRLTAGNSNVQAALVAYPELATDLDVHLDAVTALMVRTPTFNRWRVARNLLKDRGRALRRTLKVAA